MDYFIVAFIVTMNIVLSKIFGGQHWSYLSLVFNYSAGFLLYFYLIIVEKQIVRSDSDCQYKKHLVMTMVAIAVFSIGSVLINAVLNVSYVMNDLGLSSFGSALKLLSKGMVQLAINNFVLFTVNVLVFLAIKRFIFSMALTVKKSKI